ncbi:hypothetical protein [Rhodoglobus sp.]
MNPLTEEHALQEAQLLEVRFDALRLKVGILFDLRMALQLREATTGLLVASGVRDFSWSGPSRDTAMTCWTIDGSELGGSSDSFELVLGLWPPAGELVLRADSAAFFAGDVTSLRGWTEDYIDLDRSEVDAYLPHWNSSFSLVSAVFRDA